MLSLPGGSEWIIIALVVLLLFGGKKIPELMRGLGKGVLKESREQARIIRNAARYLTDEAKESSIVASTSDNRRSYDNSVTSTVQVQQLVVRDEADIRALAVEIATLTRRQQRGRGLRMA